MLLCRSSSSLSINKERVKSDRNQRSPKGDDLRGNELGTISLASSPVDLPFNLIELFHVPLDPPAGTADGKSYSSSAEGTTFSKLGSA